MFSYTRAAGESNRKGEPERWQGARHVAERRGRAIRRGSAVAALIGAPALAASGDGRLELFVFDITASLWQTAWSYGWTAWASHGHPDLTSGAVA
jgi:hypothetical protein